ncbi:SapC family protein [Streptomyces sp. CC208A]|uniref:SapC family protein n=1 Tax=Streptomyces sp. CC208A TaxID=3044573 RepID=UPI0024A8F550|nr:SapC family protein [Streptomyces sp. CC208A]
MRWVPLNRTDHASLRVVMPQNARFAADAHIAVLSAGEFTEAALAYPIVFADNDGHPVPCALLGLEQGSNQYVMPDGNWRPHTYLPLSVRSYPFTAMVMEGGGFDVLVDADYTGFGAPEGDRLFEDDGGFTPFLTGVLELLGHSARETEATRGFVAELLRLDLLVQETITLTDEGGSLMALGSFRFVDDEKLRKVRGRDLNRLHEKGYLGLIHAHRVSVHHMKRLMGELVGG